MDMKQSRGGDGVRAAEAALASACCQMGQALEWASSPASVDTAAVSAPAAARVESSVSLPFLISMQSVEGCCFEDCSGRRVVRVREGDDPVLVYGNRPVPVVLTSYYFEV